MTSFDEMLRERAQTERFTPTANTADRLDHSLREGLTRAPAERTAPLRWMLAAACALLLVVMGVTVLPGLRPAADPQPVAASQEPEGFYPAASLLPTVSDSLFDLTVTKAGYDAEGQLVLAWALAPHAGAPEADYVLVWEVDGVEDATLVYGEENSASYHASPAASGSRLFHQVWQGLERTSRTLSFHMQAIRLDESMTRGLHEKLDQLLVEAELRGGTLLDRLEALNKGTLAATLEFSLDVPATQLVSGSYGDFVSTIPAATLGDCETSPIRVWWSNAVVTVQFDVVNHAAEDRTFTWDIPVLQSAGSPFKGSIAEPSIILAPGESHAFQTTLIAPSALDRRLLLLKLCMTEQESGTSATPHTWIQSEPARCDTPLMTGEVPLQDAAYREEPMGTRINWRVWEATAVDGCAAVSVELRSTNALALVMYQLRHPSPIALNADGISSAMVYTGRITHDAVLGDYSLWVLWTAKNYDLADLDLRLGCQDADATRAVGTLLGQQFQTPADTAKPSASSDQFTLTVDRAAYDDADVLNLALSIADKLGERRELIVYLTAEGVEAQAFYQQRSESCSWLNIMENEANSSVQHDYTLCIPMQERVDAALTVTAYILEPADSRAGNEAADGRLTKEQVLASPDFTLLDTLTLPVKVAKDHFEHFRS